MWITWPVWQTRSQPPALPLLPLPQFDMGVPLVVCLAAIAIRPGLGDAWTQVAPWARAASATRLIMPAGYWLGVTDASLAHSLYAGNVPRAFICTPFSRVDINTRLVGLNVFVPPEQRLFNPLFLGVGRSGEWMEVEDPRWIAARSGWARRRVRWTDLVPTLNAEPAPVPPHTDP